MAKLKATSITGGLTISGDTTLSDGSIICPKDDDKGILPHTNNWGQIGSSDKKFYRIYATNFYGQLHGQAASASLLALHNTSSTVSTEASDWPASFSNMTYVWRQRWKDTNLSTDTGDLVLALRKAGEGSTELCMALDGDYYVHGNKCLHEGNYTSYVAPKTHGGSYFYTSGFDSAFRTATKGDSSNGAYFSTIRTDTGSLSNAAQYGSGIAFGEGDTHGYLQVSYSGPLAYIGGGNANKLNWVRAISFTDHTHNYLTDKTNGTASYLNYGASAVTSASYLAAWNGYELRAIAPSTVRSVIGAQAAGSYASSSHTHSLSSLGLKFTTIIANGSAATSASWTNNAYDFLIGCARPASSNTPTSFSIATNHCADVQVTDEVQCTIWTTTGTGMTRKSGSGTIFGLWGVNVV